MKKYLFLAIISVFLVNVSTAQISFSLDGAPQLSWMKSDKSIIESDGSKFGFKFGLNLDFYFDDNQRYAFATGVKINNMSGGLIYNTADSLAFDLEGTMDSLPSGINVTYKLQYLELPIGLKFKSNEVGYMTYFMQVGLTPLINIKAMGSGSHDFRSFEDIKINKEVRLFGLGYHIGGGMEYNLGGTTSLLVGITYMNGFMDVTSNDNKDKTILNAVSLSLGIKF